MSSNDDMLRDHQRTWNSFVRLFFAGGLVAAIVVGILGLAFYA
jgi:hypothetical protein